MGKCVEIFPYLFKMIELEGDRGYSVGLLFPEFHVFSLIPQNFLDLIKGGRRLVMNFKK